MRSFVIGKTWGRSITAIITEMVGGSGTQFWQKKIILHIPHFFDVVRDVLNNQFFFFSTQTLTFFLT